MEKEKDKEKEAIMQKLKENGCRITKQRMEILDVILQNQCSSCKEKFSFKLNMTYSNLVNYTFVSRIETFIFSLYLLSPETGDSGSQ